MTLPTTLVDGVHLLGGELLTWSDREHSPAAFSGPAAAAYLSGLPKSGRALLVGPHGPAVARALAARTSDLDVLVRSWPDALALRDELGERASIGCGPARKLFATSRRYDVVVALDGLTRLEGHDLEPLGWEALLTGLTGLLAPGGRLLLGLHNPASYAALTAPPEAGDAGWPLPPGAGAQPSALADVLEATGLEADCHAVFPDLAAPSVLARATVLEQARSDDRLVALVDRAVAAPGSGSGSAGVPLADPRSAAARAVRSGVGMAHAPGWLVTLGPAVPGADRLGADLLVAEPERADGAHAAYALEPEGAWGEPTPWRRTVLVEPAARGPVRRDPARLAAPVPAGTSLEGAVLAACAAYDETAVRDLLQAWAGLVRALPADQGACAGAEQVLLTADGAVLADDSWALPDPPTSDVVLLALFIDLGLRIEQRAAAHPWDMARSPRQLGATFATMAGLAPSEEDHAAAEALLVVTGRVPAGTDLGAVVGAGRVTSLAAARAEVARLAAEVDLRQGQVDWLIGRIHRRELQVRTNRQRIADLRKELEQAAARTSRLPWRRRAAAPEPAPAPAPAPVEPSPAAAPAPAPATPGTHEWRPDQTGPRKRERYPELFPPGYVGTAMQDDEDPADS